jgi:hypothetical protein
MSHETFQAGDLTAIIGDNAAYDDRRPSYNGIHRLVHRTKPDTSLFGIAGLNLEHIFDGDKDLLDLAGDRKVFFEPRHHPMELRKLLPTEAELYQSPPPPPARFCVNSFRRPAARLLRRTPRCHNTDKTEKDQLTPAPAG